VPELEFRILGPLELLRDGAQVDFGGPRQRSLLAALLLDTGERVSVDRLIECIWSAEPPASARHLVHVYVSQLRHLLGEQAVLRSRSAGYVLEIDPESVDASRFERLIRAARAARDAGRPDEALDLYDLGLGLWQGPILGDLDLGTEFEPALRRLGGQRLTAAEERAELMLEGGRHDELVPELERLVTEEPLRERLRAQLMLALYRSGRQSDALAAYRDAHHYLNERLGIEPGPELRRLERAILDHDPSLEGSPPVKSENSDVESNIGWPLRARANRTRQLIAAVVALVAVGIAAAGVVLFHATRSGPRSLEPGEVGILDGTSGRLLAAIPTDGTPSAIAVGQRATWIGDGLHNSVLEVDHRAEHVRRAVRLGAPPHALTFAGNALWIADGFDGKLQRLSRGQVSRPFRPTPTSQGRLALTPGAGSLWIASQDGLVVRIDPRTRRVQARIHVGLSNDLVFDATGIWLAAATQDALLHLDPLTNRVVSTIPIGGIPQAVTTGAGSIWATTPAGNRVWRIDPRHNAVVASIPATDQPKDIAVTNKLVWVGSGSSPVIVAIDPRTNQVVRTIHLAAPADHLVGDRGRLWLTLIR
jgi:DNA-binding SARP family transcriptional activator/streptogramin lyase